MANHQIVDDISLKYIYEIAKTKQEMDKNFKDIPLQSNCKVTKNNKKVLKNTFFKKNSSN